MAFGVDTINNLDTEIDWAAFRAWKGQYPEFAGRYFGGGYNPGDSEFTGAKSQTDGVLTRIFPLRGAEPSQADTGSNGYNLCADAAAETCGKIDAFRASGQLALPDNGQRVHVYADWEGNLPISVDWWVGWANKIWHFTGDCYCAALYCPFEENADGLWVPAAAVQDVLDNAAAAYPGTDYAPRCYGFSAPSPFYYDYCTAAGTSDWSVFGTYSMPVEGGGTANVPVLIHQYAETSCKSNGYPDYAGGQNLDMDGSDSTGAEEFMMVIQ